MSDIPSLYPCSVGWGRRFPPILEGATRRCGQHPWSASLTAIGKPDEEYAKRQDWDLVDRHIYFDEGLSGSGADRPGFVRLREAALSKPRPFDVLLVDDTSRLTRNQSESARFCEDLTFAGVRFVFDSQGIDSQSEQADMLMTGNPIRATTRWCRPKGRIWWVVPIGSTSIRA
jgi:hypothetical protein